MFKVLVAEDALNRVCPCVIRVAGPGGDAVAGNSSRLGGQTVHVEHGENIKTSRRNIKIFSTEPQRTIRGVLNELALAEANVPIQYSVIGCSEATETKQSCDCVLVHSQVDQLQTHPVLIRVHTTAEHHQEAFLYTFNFDLSSSDFSVGSMPLWLFV